MIIMSTNGEDLEKTITYNPTPNEVIKELRLKEDYGFQVVKFNNEHYGVNYINPVKNINETVMISVDKNPLAPLTFLKYAELAYGRRANFDLSDAEKVELCVMVDPENKETYREIINGDDAETLLEKMNIAREIVEMKNEADFWLNHGTSIILVCVLINVALVIFNIIRLNGGI